MNKLLDFLYNSDTIDTNELRKDLSSLGIDVADVENRAARIIASTERSLNLSWIERARTRQSQFEEKLRQSSLRLSEAFKDRRRFVENLLSGRMGSPLKERAAVFFRNQNPADISEEELKSFLEDCELLDLL
ncbi:MAG: hypothetical protein AB1540_03605 [Bdellovibrionota bacterium]